VLAHRSKITYGLLILMLTTINGFKMLVKVFNIAGISIHQIESIWTL
jgi:hypothetical protein